MILIFGEIISDLETPSFGFDKKLIVAKNTGLFKKEGRKKAKKDDQSMKTKLLDYFVNICDFGSANFRKSRFRPVLSDSAAMEGFGLGESGKFSYLCPPV